MELKVLALGTTSLIVLGLATSPAIAKSNMMGVVHLGTGHTWADQDECEDCDDESMNIFGGAKVNLPYSDNVNVQIDVLGDSSYANEEDDNNFGSAFTAVGHINYRDKDGFLGVFGATGRTSSIDEDTTSFFAAGFEGALHGSTWIAGAQIGWLDSCCDNDATGTNDWLHEAGFARVNGTWFASPDLAVGASLAYVDGVQDTADDAVLWEWTAFAEKMIGQNTSVFVEYRGVHAEETFAGGGTGDRTVNHAVNGGFKFHFNATDLFTSITEGASAETLNFGRWVSEAGEQID